MLGSNVLPNVRSRQHYWWAEESLIKAGIPTTVLRGNFYMVKPPAPSHLHVEL